MVQGRHNFLSTFNIVLTASCVESIILSNWWLFSLTFLRNRNTHLKFFPSPPNVDDSCRRRRRSSTQNRLLMFGYGRHVECRPAAGGSRPLKVTANITELVSPNCYRKPERAAPGIAPLQSPTFPPGPTPTICWEPASFLLWERVHSGLRTVITTMHRRCEGGLPYTEVCTHDIISVCVEK